MKKLNQQMKMTNANDVEFTAPKYFEAWKNNPEAPLYRCSATNCAVSTILREKVCKKMNNWNEDLSARELEKNISRAILGSARRAKDETGLAKASWSIVREKELHARGDLNSRVFCVPFFFPSRDLVSHSQQNAR